jgi:hypothetical protein
MAWGVEMFALDASSLFAEENASTPDEREPG